MALFAFFQTILLLVSLSLRTCQSEGKKWEEHKEKNHKEKNEVNGALEKSCTILFFFGNELELMCSSFHHLELVSSNGYLGFNLPDLDGSF